MSGARKAVVAGATGLVGRALVQLLGAREDVTVTALVRKAGAFQAPINELVFDYESDDDYAKLGSRVPVDFLFCCLGTTRRVAGSDEAFLRVDRDYPKKLVLRAKELEKPPLFGLVSSYGAERGGGLYLGAKKAVEDAITESGIPYVIVRPSLLVGDRGESRPMERVGLAASKPLFAMLRAFSKAEIVEKTAPISVEQVARALVHHAFAEATPHVIAEGSALTKV